MAKVVKIHVNSTPVTQHRNGPSKRNSIGMKSISVFPFHGVYVALAVMARLSQNSAFGFGFRSGKISL